MQSWWVHALPCGPMQNFVYLLACPETRACVVVDPAWDADAICAEADRLGLHIEGLACTHSHHDHINRVEALLSRLDVPVHVLGEEARFGGLRFPNQHAHSPGDTLSVGRRQLTLLHTPGHTPGSMTLALPSRAGGPVERIVTGDTLFVGGCGRCDLSGGDPAVMYDTLWRLVHTLPPGTIVHPGHDYGPTPTSSLDRERQANRWYQHPTLTAFLQHRAGPKAGQPPRGA